MRSIAMAADLVARARGALSSCRVFEVLTWSGMLALSALSVIPAADRPVTGSYKISSTCSLMAALAFAPASASRPRCLSDLPPRSLSPVLSSSRRFRCRPRHARLDDFVVDAVGACVGMMAGTLVRLAVRDKA